MTWSEEYRERLRGFVEQKGEPVEIMNPDAESMTSARHELFKIFADEGVADDLANLLAARVVAAGFTAPATLCTCWRTGLPLNPIAMNSNCPVHRMSTSTHTTFNFYEQSRNAAKATVQCCCNYGAAGRGEYPEFGCPDCPVHKGGLGEDDEDRCRRHRMRRDAIIEYFDSSAECAVTEDELTAEDYKCKEPGCGRHLPCRRHPL